MLGTIWVGMYASQLGSKAKTRGGRTSRAFLLRDKSSTTPYDMVGLGPTKMQASKFPLYVSVISDGLLRQSSHGGEKKKEGKAS